MCLVPPQPVPQMPVPPKCLYLLPLISPFSLFGDQVMTIATMAHEPCDQHGYKLCGQHGCEPHSKHVANMIYVTPNIKRLMIDSLIISPSFVQGFHKHISIVIYQIEAIRTSHLVVLSEFTEIKKCP